MRIRAVIEFDLDLREGIPSIEAIAEYHKEWTDPNATPVTALMTELKYLLEDEYRGMAQYDTTEVISLEIADGQS